MSTEIFKNIILSYFLLALFFFLSGYQGDELYFETSEIFFSSLFCFGFFYCLYSLYKLKPIGKKLFVPIILIGMMLEYSIGYENLIFSDLERMLLNLEYLLVGIIFTCLYFTDLKKEFEK